MESDTTKHNDESFAALLQAGIAAAQGLERDRAHELLARAVELEEDHVEARLWLSRVVEDLDLRQAHLERVLEIDPGNEAAQDEMAEVQRARAYQWLHQGRVAVQEGEPERARELFMRVVEQDERNAEAWMRLSGVVESLEEREICLENVLTLEPDNEMARNVLTLVREERRREQAGGSEDLEGQEAPSEPPRRQGFFLSPVDATEAGAEAAPVAAPAVEEILPPRGDALDQPYNCPYCAASTAPEDRRCPNCGGRLWVKVQPKDTGRIWMAFTLQVVNFLLNVAGLALVLAYVAYQIDFPNGIALVPMYLGFPDAVPASVAAAALEVVPRLTFLTLFGMSVFSLIVLISILFRWRIAFYLFLVSGAELAVVGVMITLLLWDAANWELEVLNVAARGGLVALDASLALVVIGLALEMRLDLFARRQRLRLRVDSDAVGGMALLSRGRAYGRRGLWALAAAHLRRAVAWEPNNADAYLSLAVAYAHLRWYERAEEALAEARRIDPSNPKLDDLAALLSEARSDAPAAEEG